jgi:hypothetical protein
MYMYVFIVFSCVCVWGGGGGLWVCCVWVRVDALKALPCWILKFHPVFVFQMAQYIQREVLNHKELCHPHIVAMKEVTMALAVDWPSS